MTTLSYGNPAAEEVRRIASGHGGEILVIAGDGRGTLFDAGCYRPPAKTLLEAVLTFAAAGPVYKRIVVMTGTGNHLPQRVIVGSENIGHVPAIWLFRGDASVEHETEDTVDEEDPGAVLRRGRLQRDTTQGHVITPLQGGRDWEAHIGKVLAQIERECGVAYSSGNYISADQLSRDHTLIILDEHLLIPRDDQIESLHALGDVPRTLLENRLNEVPELVRKSPNIDLMLLATASSTIDALVDGRMIRHQVQRRFARNDPNSTIAQFTPGMHWTTISTAEMSQVKQDSPHGPYLQNCDHKWSLYDALRQAPVRKPQIVVRPPADPTKVMVEFWANVDVSALETRLLHEVIGQRPAINTVVEHIGSFQAMCKRAKPNRELPNRRDCIPPCFVFTGPAGMGKSYLGNLIAQELFGATEHFRLIDLAGRMPGEALLGTEAGYLGFGGTPEFVRFCHTTRGLGAIIFDELDKVRPGPREGMREAMNTFLNLVLDRSLTPRDSEHATRDGKLWLKNVILMFTANLDSSGDRFGYGSTDELGAAMLQRFGPIVEFQELQTEGMHDAVSFFLSRYLAHLVEHGSFEGVVQTDADVFQYLAHTFDQTTASTPGFRSNRVLEEKFIPHFVQMKTMWDKFDRNSFTLCMEDLNPEPWSPIG